MSAFSFKITVEAKDSAEAEKKLNAACVLLEKLSASELTSLAEVVKNDPKTLALAKGFLKLK